MNQTRVLLADDNKPLVVRVAELLAPLFDVVGSAVNGKDLVSQSLRLRPDVIVTDITMPVFTGLEAVRQLRAAGLQAKFVFLTIHNESEFLEACLEEGAIGYVLKTQMTDDLIPAICAAVAGKRYVSSAMSIQERRREFM